MWWPPGRESHLLPRAQAEVQDGAKAPVASSPELVTKAWWSGPGGPGLELHRGSPLSDPLLNKTRPMMLWGCGELAGHGGSPWGGGRGHAPR
jgi:hypothetical protein